MDGRNVAYSLELLHEGASFLEGPRWHRDRWYFSDFYRHRVITIAPGGEVAEIARVEHQPSGLGFLPDDSLLIVSMTDRRLLRLVDGELAVHADLSDVAPGNLNDMVVDSGGRAYVGHQGEGNIGLERPGWPPSYLLRVDLDGRSTVEGGDLYGPNGIVLTDDENTLIVAETMRDRFTAYTVNADGHLSNPRIWAQSDTTPYSPDGCCIDAEGLIWAAAFRQDAFFRIAPGGEVVDVIPAPDGYRAIACMLGGDDGRTLALVLLGVGEGHPKDRRDSCVATTTVSVPHGGRP